MYPSQSGKLQFTATLLVNHLTAEGLSIIWQVFLVGSVIPIPGCLTGGQGLGSLNLPEILVLDTPFLYLLEL